jgi:hypothetical protein
VRLQYINFFSLRLLSECFFLLSLGHVILVISAFNMEQVPATSSERTHQKPSRASRKIKEKIRSEAARSFEDQQQFGGFQLWRQ